MRVSKRVQSIAVPDVLGQTESSARAELEAAGFEVSVTEAPDDDTPQGLVAAQSPSAGTEAPRKSTVQITISTGPELTTVPDVIGLDASDARAQLQDAGFRTRTIFTDVTDPAEDGVVQDQNPAGDSQARPNSTVTILVGRLP